MGEEYSKTCLSKEKKITYMHRGKYGEDEASMQQENYYRIQWGQTGQLEWGEEKRWRQKSEKEAGEMRERIGLIGRGVRRRKELKQYSLSPPHSQCSHESDHQPGGGRRGGRRGRRGEYRWVARNFTRCVKRGA